ncbi:peptidase [Streptomyces inusitatus]|uniref:Peptidase n=1 Tax=Streptomyces inusitatus TaxID=68221 RepID=A0A918QCC9_9ACTN|nr:oxygenase MpaB family protein [Streptomyces inusitatus]GGZ39644.1 peptidase [Streptomyces inusitatus]
MRRYDRLKEIRRMDPERDFHEMYRLIAAYEFPWDFTRALELALFRTYAVPSIGSLLFRTAEFTERTQKRYDDTVLLLDAVVEHGFASERGRTAIRRINQMHRRYDIGDGDMRYVLSTFVVVPKRWIDAYGWRRLTDHELRACTAYYRHFGQHMGIPDIPETFAEFEELLDTYEAEHFGWDEGGRAVADATLDLMASWYPRPLAPGVRAAGIALLDEPLLKAFRLPARSPLLRGAVGGALRLRGRAVRLLPPRRAPHFGRLNPEIKGYPRGYRLADLGTHPTPGIGACPVPHRLREAERAD